MITAMLCIFIGVIVSIIRKRSDIFVTWPAVLVLAKRLK
jgi:hypothetical protein